MNRADQFAARAVRASKARQPLLETLEQRVLLTTVWLSMSTTEITEAGGVPAVFTVSRDDTVGDLVVRYRVGGSEPTSHIAENLSGVLVIPAGSSTATLSATPINDGVQGYNNTLTIQLLDPDGNGYSLTTDPAKVTQGTVRIDESTSLPAGYTYLTVGPGKMYADPWTALGTVSNNNGVCIDIWPSASGQYTMPVGSVATGKIYYNNVTIRGIGAGRVKTFNDPTQDITNDKGIFVMYDGQTNCTIENLDLEGARGPSGNDAGLRMQGINWTVRNCYFTNDQFGILSGGTTPGDALVEYCEFNNSGGGSGSHTHNLYINNTATFTFRYNWTHDATSGHLVKTRARTNYILYNRLVSVAGGTESMEIDVPDAGKTYIIGNIIRQAPASENSTIISYAEEHAPQAGDYLYIVNNTIVNDKDTSGTIFVHAPLIPAGFNVTIKNNIMVGHGTLWNLGGGVTPTTAGNYINTSLTSPNFVNAGLYDYHLQSNSPAIGVAVDPGTSSDGYSLMPTLQYVTGNGFKSRYTGGALDAGAYDRVADMMVSSIGPSIATGDVTPSATDGTAFGTANASLAQTITRTFTIANTGQVALSLSGSPLVALSGTNAGDFAVIATPSASIAGVTGTSSFQIRFTPTNVGIRTALVTIANSDPTKSPYTFAISGTATGYVGDTDLSGFVDLTDLQILAANWYKAPTNGWKSGDFDASNLVDLPDLQALGAHWYTSASSAALSGPSAASAVSAPSAAPSLSLDASVSKTTLTDVASLTVSAVSVAQPAASDEELTATTLPTALSATIASASVDGAQLDVLGGSALLAVL